MGHVWNGLNEEQGERYYEITDDTGSRRFHILPATIDAAIFISENSFSWEETALYRMLRAVN